LKNDRHRRYNSGSSRHVTGCQEEVDGFQSQEDHRVASVNRRDGHFSYQKTQGEERSIVASHQKIPGCQLQSQSRQVGAFHQEVFESRRR